MEVQSSIIKTLAFFKLFNHPLTGWELNQWLYATETVEFSEVLAAVHQTPGVKEANGFFFLSDAAARQREERQIEIDRKFQSAQKAARLISWAPFVKLAAVCNTLSFGAVEKESDIDFFIVAQKNRLWTVRFFVTVILSFFALRRHGRKIANRICLSFFVTDDNLDLQSIALPQTNFVILNEAKRSEESLPIKDGILRFAQDDNVGIVSSSSRQGGTPPRNDQESIPDIYLIYWITQLVPLINRSQTLEKFWQANLWVKKYLANFSFESQLPDYRQIKIPAWAESCRRLRETVTAGRLGDRREKVLRWLQLKKMSQKENRQASGTAVIINDQMLKFHEEDRREEFRERWERIYLDFIGPN